MNALAMAREARRGQECYSPRELYEQALADSREDRSLGGVGLHFRHVMIEAGMVFAPGRNGECPVCGYDWHDDPERPPVLQDYGKSVDA